MNTAVKHILFNCSLVTKFLDLDFSLILVTLQLLVHWFETSNVSQVQGYNVAWVHKKLEHG